MDRGYSLLQAYATGAGLVEIYVNIGSPLEIDGAQLRFTDYELDVSRKPPHTAALADGEEFLEAAARYGYSEEFQETCYEVAGEAIEVANNWIARGMREARVRHADEAERPGLQKRSVDR